MFALTNILTIGFLSLILPLTTAQGFKKFHDFSKSCTNITLNKGAYLSAHCTPMDPSKPAQNNDDLNLNLCVRLDLSTGEFEWDVYGKFSNDCKNCALNTNYGFFLECECTSWDTHETKNATLDLDTGIGNYDGLLVCYTTGPTDAPDVVTTTTVY